MSDSTTFTIRLPTTELDRIEQAATQAGLNRTQYILSWLPEHYDSDTKNGPSGQHNNAR